MIKSAPTPAAPAEGTDGDSEKPKDKKKDAKKGSVFTSIAWVVALIIVVIALVQWIGSNSSKNPGPPPLSQFDMATHKVVFFELRPGQPGVYVRMKSNGASTETMVTGNSVVNVIPVNSMGQALAGAPAVLGGERHPNLQRIFVSFEWMYFYQPPEATGPSQVRIVRRGS